MDVFWFFVVYFKNEGMVLEYLVWVEFFYVVLESFSFFLMGILLWIVSGICFFIFIIFNILIYYYFYFEDIKFYLYFVFSDVLLIKVIDDEEDCFYGVCL